MSISKVLIVDDEESVLNSIRRVLRKESFEVTLTPSPEEALERLCRTSYAVVLSDQRMPTMEGTVLLEKTREISPETVRMLLTGYVGTRVAVEAINRGAVSRFIAKPWDDEELRLALRQAVGQYELRMENRRLQALSERQNTELKALNRDLAQARKQEIKIASRIQQMLLLGQPPGDIRGVKLAALTVPSQEIDGDFYDFFRLNDRCLDILVGDVMGKGVPAALLGAATKSRFLRALGTLMSSLDAGTLPEPEDIVTSVHSEITGQLIDLESFVTACHARFNLQEGRLDLVNCGHTRTIHFRQRTGRCEALQGGQMPLGFSRKEVYKQASIPIEAGDAFLLYSDGVTEAKNEKGECFGEERLVKLAGAISGYRPEEMIGRVQEEIVAFSGSAVFDDDLTCIALRVQGDGA